MHPLTGSASVNVPVLEGGQGDAIERQGILAEANAAVPRLDPGEARFAIG